MITFWKYLLQLFIDYQIYNGKKVRRQNGTRRTLISARDIYKIGCFDEDIASSLILCC